MEPHWSTDRTEGWVCVVTRIADRHDAVSTEVRLIEVRMVGDVVELRAERKHESLVQLEVLEDREIKAMESGSRNLIALEAQRCGAADRNAIRLSRDSAIRVSAVGVPPMRHGLGEGSRVSDPEGIMNAARSEP